MRKNSVIVCVLLSLALTSAAKAQPPPVDLQILNIPQETPYWCWAAVAEQIIAASVGRERTPPQCALVAMAYGSDPAMCCNGNPRCWVTASLPQIQLLMARFGGRYSALAPPADPMILYQTLAAGRAIILLVRSGPGTSHVVVLRGMHFIPTPYGWEAVLHVNDPMQIFTQPVPFRQLIGSWMGAIVVN